MSVIDQYIKLIVEELYKCDDIEIFDIILHLLKKNSLQKER